MSADDNEAKDMGGEPTAYEVGHGKPPLDRRFVKGRSGNPSGRPKGARNKLPHLNEERLKSIVLEEAYRLIKVNDGDRQVKLPMAQAIIRSLAVAAAKGQPRAQIQFTKLLIAVEHERKALHDQWMDAAIDYKLKWESELARRRRLGLAMPDLALHPDHLVIDVRAGTIQLTEPLTEEERAVLDEFEQRASEEGRDVIEVLKEARDRIGAGPR